MSPSRPRYIGDNVVRCIAMSSTDGLVRGYPRSTPALRSRASQRRELLGHLHLSACRSTRGPVGTEKSYPIHRPAPSSRTRDVDPEIFETGIKVVDLLAPYQKGGKVGLFGAPAASPSSFRS
jgi:F-type H+-transporting ATPase subunit beta